MVESWKSPFAIEALLALSRARNVLSKSRFCSGKDTCAPYTRRLAVLSHAFDTRIHLVSPLAANDATGSLHSATMTQEGDSLSRLRTIPNHFAAINSSITHTSMASATTSGLTSPSHLVTQSTSQDYQKHCATRTHDANGWATLLRKAFVSLQQNNSDGVAPALRNDALNAPRRRHADVRSSQLAAEIASLLYPAPLDAGLSQLIKYGKLITDIDFFELLPRVYA